MSGYVQWTSPDGTRYFPAGAVQKQLPPGYYEVNSGMMGLYFSAQPVKTESLLRFPDSSSDKIIEEIEKFWDMEHRFRESNIPYKRGILLYGPPGGGKSCTIRLAVENLVKNRAGVVIDWPGVGLFKEGLEVLRAIHPTMPLITLMEDVDAILRRSSESEVLNVLDGMYGVDKVIFLATTNYPEQLGSRIMNRPSRFDKRMLIGMPNAVAREMYLRTKKLADEEVRRWTRDTDGFSIAHLKELYVANKILGDSYDSSLRTLRKMKNSVSSRSFDDYGCQGESPTSMDSCAKKAVGKMLAIPKLMEAKEKFYGQFGKGTLYQEFKKKNEGTPDGIANLISEDVRSNNGLIID